MTEAEWLACTDPQEMLDFLRGRASDRKLRLFACACCRLSGGFEENRALRAAVSLMERHADGMLPPHEYPTYNTFTHDTLACGVAAYVHRGVDVPAGAGWGASYRCSGNARAFDPAAGAIHCDLLRDIFRDPRGPGQIAPSCRAGEVAGVAGAIYAERAFDRMPELADALAAAGCPDGDLLAHCGGPGPHVRGCWVVDLILGKG